MSMGQRAAVTSADVAREAGLSRATVSYALNGDPDSRLAPATRQRVLDAAERLGYEPSASARLLRGGRSRTILMLSADGEEPNARLTSFVKELSRALGRHGFSLVWQLGVSGIPRPVGELSPALVLTEQTADDAEFARLASGFRVPVLSAIGGRDAFIAAPAAAQVRHLVERGFERIQYFRPAPPEMQTLTDLRLGAARAAASAAGAALEVVDLAAGRRGATEALRALAGPLAICAYNDDTALAVLGAAADLGLRVPHDVAVIGVDDVPAAELSVPALTTVRPLLDDYIAAFAEAVAAIATGEEAHLPQLPEHCELVVRATT